MITIGYSTREHNPKFIEYLKKSSGFKKIEVIEKINNEKFRPVVMDGDTVKLTGADTLITNNQLVLDIISQISAMPDLDITEVENQLEN
mgnify:CR=1 FL=1